jgi:hypothetical protein
MLQWQTASRDTGVEIVSVVADQGRHINILIIASPTAAASPGVRSAMVYDTIITPQKYNPRKAQS